MLLLLHCSWEIMEPVGAHAGKEATSASEVATRRERARGVSTRGAAAADPVQGCAGGPVKSNAGERGLLQRGNDGIWWPWRAVDLEKLQGY
jgi:hypothetical protein